MQEKRHSVGGQGRNQGKATGQLPYARNFQHMFGF